MTTAECVTVEQWQSATPWPPTKADMAELDRIITAQIAAAEAKMDELGMPAFCKPWVKEYRGLTSRGTHIWDGAIRTGGDDYCIFWEFARKQSANHGADWRTIDRWDNGYRQVLISPKHRLTLSYCEGDITLVFCPTRQHFSAELRDAHQFYDKH